MSLHVNHESELTAISQQASIACSANILLVILRRSTTLATVSPKSAENVVDQNRIQWKREELISCRRKKLRFWLRNEDFRALWNFY